MKKEDKVFDLNLNPEDKMVTISSRIELTIPLEDIQALSPDALIGMVYQVVRRELQDFGIPQLKEFKKNHK